MATLFEKFGGIRAMAEALSEAPSTVQSWKTTSRIPAHKQPGVISRAQELGLPVSAEDVVWPLGKPLADGTSVTLPHQSASSGNPDSDSQQEAA